MEWIPIPPSAGDNQPLQLYADGRFSLAPFPVVFDRTSLLQGMIIGGVKVDKAFGEGQQLVIHTSPTTVYRYEGGQWFQKPTSAEQRNNTPTNASPTQRPRAASNNNTKVVVLVATLFGVFLGYSGVDYLFLVLRNTYSGPFGPIVSGVSGFLFGYGAYRNQRKAGEPIEQRELMRVLQSTLALVAVSFLAFFLLALTHSFIWGMEDSYPQTLMLFITVPLSLFFGHRMYLALSSNGGERVARAKRTMLTLLGGVAGILLCALIVEVLLGTPFFIQIEMPLLLLGLVIGSALSWFFTKKL